MGWVNQCNFAVTIIRFDSHARSRVNAGPLLTKRKLAGVSVDESMLSSTYTCRTCSRATKCRKYAKYAVMSYRLTCRPQWCHIEKARSTPFLIFVNYILMHVCHAVLSICVSAIKGLPNGGNYQLLLKQNPIIKRPSQSVSSNQFLIQTWWKACAWLSTEWCLFSKFWK